MVAFIIGISQAWARGLTIDCGCFGGGGQIGAAETRYPQEIARDAAFALAGGVARLATPHPRLPRPLPLRTLTGAPDPHGQEAVHAARLGPPGQDRGRPQLRGAVGANKIVVAAVVVIVAIIAVVGGVIWVQQS